jgi:hypothetical protein
VLGVFDIVEASVVGAATLAILALLAVSGIANRHQLDDVRREVAAFAHGEVEADRYLHDRTPALNEEIRSAMQINFVGVTLTRTVRELVGGLDERLRAGATVRVIIMDPDSNAPAEAAARGHGVTSKDFYQPRLKSTIDLLAVLRPAASGADSLQVRLLPFVPTFGVCLIDPQGQHGRAFVEIYQPRSLEPNPKFALRANRDVRWFGFFSRQFDTLWESARPLPADS